MVPDTDLIMICTSDIAGQIRGKAIPRKHVESRKDIGIGWTPTNIFITSFGPIAPSPWGARGDLLIRPDYSSEVEIEEDVLGLHEHFVLGDILNLNGEKWSCCIRGILKTALAELEETYGLRLNVAFEHEFHYSGVEEQPGLGYGLRAYRRLGSFANDLMRVLDQAGLGIDTFMPEYGPGQCEVTVKPASALRAADEAIILRELTRATARAHGHKASFTPIKDPDGVGNGLHVHFSFEDLNGTPKSYDPNQPLDVDAQAGSFLAGISKYIPDLISLTCASVPSYYRLQPNRWSAVYNNLAQQDREAALRICPVFGTDQKDIEKKFHFEFRAADCAASPYLVLATLVLAGLQGMKEGLSTPEQSETSLSELSPAELTKLGYRRFAGSLDEALDLLEANEFASSAFGEEFIQAFLSHKRCEAEIFKNTEPKEICEAYQRAY